MTIIFKTATMLFSMKSVWIVAAVKMFLQKKKKIFWFLLFSKTLIFFFYTYYLFILMPAELLGGGGVGDISAEWYQLNINSFSFYFPLHFSI